MKIRILALINKCFIIFLVLLASIMMPFNIYADTLPQSEIVGVTYNKIDETVSYLNGSGTWVYVYEIEVLLRNKYVGVVDGTLSYSYAESPNSQTVTTSKRTYVNGDSFKLNVSITQFGSSYSGSAPMYSASFLVNAQNTNVTKYEDLNSIETVVSILQDIYTNSSDIENLSTNQLTELEKIVSNTSLANTYLDSISKLRQYNIPIESWRANFTPLNTRIPKTYQNISYWNYPVYDLTSGNKVLSEWNYANHTTTFIFGTYNNINEQNYSSYFSFSQNFDITITDILTSRLGDYKFIKLNINHPYGSTFDITASQNISNFVYIYVGDLADKNISTDFALQWGLSNQLLDDLHIIAQGTSASNQQSQDLSSGTDSMQDQMDDLVGIEDSYNQQFNNSVNSIDFNNPLQQNQCLLGASNFVITVFNGLIANNPFSILIIIVCILLIGKKVIGK